MSPLDRTMVTILAAACVWCAWAFTHLAGAVAGTERHHTPVTIVPTPTTTAGEKY